MNNKVIIGALAGVIVAGGAFFFLTKDKPSEQKNSPCAEICRQANSACPSLIDQEKCISKCDVLSGETKNHLQESANCEQLSAKPELIAELIIPEPATPELVPGNTSECEAACGSYVGKCLTLVPNATAALFDDGLASCMTECVDWDAQKVECMISAFDCEAMTNVCGL